MTARPRVALIGSGSMGSLHARVLAQSPDCDFVLVVEPRREIGEEIAERYGAAWAPDFDDLAGIDAVVVAAPTEAHHAIGCRVLRAGRPALVEKPLAATYQQAVDLVDLAARQDIPLACGFVERFNPAVLTAREFVGDVVQVNAVRHSPFVPRIRTGVATDLLIHDVDLTIGFAGCQPTVVKGSFGYFHESSRQHGAEDSADATMSFDNGALATISASRVSQRKIRQLSLLEIDRLIEIDLLRRDITIYRHVADSHVNDGAGYQQQTVIEIPAIRHGAEPLAAQLGHFLRLIGPDSDADRLAAERATILPAHWVVHQATESARQHPTDCPAPART